MAISDIRTFVKYNVLTTAEVAERLAVTRQRVNNLVKENELTPVKVTANGSLFLLADVDEYLRKKKGENQSRLFLPPLLLNLEGITDKSVKYFMEHKAELDEIEAVYIFMDQIDAVIHNFYLPSDQIRYGELKHIDVAHFVLRDVKGKEMWLGGCNCGYGGTGPHGSKKILDQCGFSEYSDLVFSEEILKIFRDNDGNIEVFKPEKEEPLIVTNSNDSALLYFWRENPVLVQDRRFSLSDSLPVLERYRKFIPDPVQYYVFPDDETALKEGYFAPGRFNETPYRLIITDSSGRQLWLNPELNRKILSNDVLKTILESCGFDIDNMSFRSSINENWINRTLRKVPYELMRFIDRRKNKN